MDRQVLDNDGVPVTTVDDLELSGPDPATELPPGTPAPVLTALLTGPVLGTRIFGGRPPSSRLIRIPWKDVADVGVAIKLGVSGENLDAGWVERWIRDKIIARIPGGRHDPR
jgi:sporulation protein YlmC with PRC-barrel domain